MTCLGCYASKNVWGSKEAKPNPNLTKQTFYGKNVIEMVEKDHEEVEDGGRWSSKGWRW